MGHGGLVPAIHETHLDHRDKAGDDGELMARVIFMGWRRRWQMRRAAKRYARKLGPHLLKAYGAAEYYTLAQIGTAIVKLGLDTEFIVLGCAAHLSKEVFLSIAGQFPIYIPYEDAREIVADYGPHGLTSASGNPEVSLPS